MSSVGPIDQLVSVLRAQLAAKPAAPARSAASGRSREAAGSRYDDKNLMALIELRVKAIDGKDPQRGRKAFRVFLEAVLLSQFGEAMINDPKFYQLVDDVHAALESSSATAPLVEAAVDDLLKHSNQ